MCPLRRNPEERVARKVVVTGGSRGIGRAVVEYFVALDDEVIALARDKSALDSLGERVSTRSCDVADEAQVEAAFAELGQVDVLVINAGVAEAAPLGRTSMASWNHHLAVNATGAFLCTRAVIDPLLKRGSGTIITVASTAAKVGTPYTCAYTASKHAALGVMRTAAAELAGSGATANAVCPTFVETEMTQRSIERIVQVAGRNEEEARATLVAAAPLGRLLEPTEVAAAVGWLASPVATAVNGQALVLDGGGLQS